MVKEISKSFDGKLEDIISKILQDQFDKPLKNLSKESYQPKFRYIIPYLNPLKAAQNVVDKMVTENGAPYFLYSTIGPGEDLVLKDLETILSEEPSNKNSPFIYSQMYSNTAMDVSPIEQACVIEKLEMVGNDRDTLLLAQMGVYCSTYSYTDINTGEIKPININIFEIFELLKQQQIVKAPQNKIPLDRKFVPNSKDPERETLEFYESKAFHQISGRTYPFNDQLLNFSEDIPDARYYANRIYSSAFLQLMHHQEMHISMPGLFFNTQANASVGNNIDIKISKNKLIQDAADAWDEEKSGTYIITAKSHIFNTIENQSQVNLRVSRLTETDVKS